MVRKIPANRARAEKAPGKSMAPGAVGQSRESLKNLRALPGFAREMALRKAGVWPVAGCDEVGRGPLAGPVVAAAVILDPDRIPDGIDDSKRLTAERREVLFADICASASVSVAVAPSWVVDRDNIRRASLDCLARAVRGLSLAPRHVFVDGRDMLEIDCDCEAVIGGDGIVVSIAAASIVAKVTRDRLMKRLSRDYPAYGFDRHMGYSVPAHLSALQTSGACPHHRRSFAPVAEVLGLEPAIAAVAEAVGLPTAGAPSINAASQR